MICPQCGASYPRSSSRCTHCDVELVDEAAVTRGESLYCPQCGAEYRPGVAECADCEVTLTQQPPPEPSHAEPDLVKLIEVSEPSLLPVVVSLLESAGIEPVVEGDEIMGLWPVGQAGAGWTGWGRGLSVVVRVPAERAEEARALLAEVEEQAEAEGE